MDKKPTGLLYTGINETQAERAERKIRDDFIDNWIEENPDFVLELKQKTKNQLIHRLIVMLVGGAYDEVRGNTLTDGNALAMLKEYEELLDLCKRQPACTPEEKRLALENWENRMITIAGKDTIRVAEIARAAGAARVWVREQHKIKAFKDRDANLAAGRKDAVKKRQKTATTKKEKLTNAIAALFDAPEKPGWRKTNEEILAFLVEKNCTLGYKNSSILNVVKIEAAKHRKTR